MTLLAPRAQHAEVRSTAPRLRALTRELRVPATAAVDCLVVLGAAAVIGRLGTGDLGLALLFITALWLAMIALVGGYSARPTGGIAGEYRGVLAASIAAGGLFAPAASLAAVPLTPGHVVALCAVGGPALVIGRAGLHRASRHLRETGLITHRVLIAGTARSIDDIATVLDRERHIGYEVVGALVADESAPAWTPGGVHVLGTVDDAREAVRAHRPEVIVLGNGIESADQLRRLAWELENDDLEVVVVPAVTDVAGDRLQIRPVGGLPLLHLERPRGREALGRGKRWFDIAVAGSMLVALTPLLLVVAVVVRMHDDGPVLFRQARTGRDGLPFEMLKFRTMVVDAEQRLAALQAETAFGGGLFKMAGDPRITPPGRWLRKFSIDELPQLINVVRGDMSLVGPRPPLPSEVATYSPAAHRRLRVRPGLTGLWQVSGRSDVTFEEAIRLDLYYIDNWSVRQDLSILRRTVGVVLGSQGAY